MVFVTLRIAVVLLCLSWPYYVLPQGDVSTGPSTVPQSTMPSTYMRGVAAEDQQPTSLRIVGIKPSVTGLTLEVVLLDSNGNALGTATDRGTWAVSAACKTDPLGEAVVPVVAQLTWESSSPVARYAVLIDHSITSRDLATETIRGLRDILPGIPGHDSIAIATFDHTSLEITPLTTLSIAAERCGSTHLAPPSGIPAALMAIVNGMRTFEGKPNQNNTLIVVTASSDMASVVSSTASVLEKAKASGTRIVVIKVGNSAQGYMYRYLSSATGGRMYSVSYDDVGSVASIIREIIYATKHRLEAFANIRPASYSCADLLVRLAWSSEQGKVLADTMLLPLKEQQFTIAKSIVAVFEDTTDRGLQSYYPILAVLAEDLMADSSKHLRLTGHVSPDLSGDAYMRGLARAEHVAGYLKAYGVNENQIDIMSSGASKPLYYLQLDGAQRLLNNRVEAVVCRTSDLPYTIVVERVVSETIATASVERWTERGYKAYFEPSVSNHKPLYDIILWGYHSRAEAEKAGKGLKKYGVNSYNVQ